MSVDTVLVSTPLDYAQAALLLGEQRAWTESILGHDLAEVQPSARREYANLAAFYDPPMASCCSRAWRASRSGSWPSAGSRTGAARASASTCAGRRAAAALPAGSSRTCSRWLARSAAARSTSRRRRTELGAAYEWYRRLGFRETTKLNFADSDHVVAMELPL